MNPATFQVQSVSLSDTPLLRRILEIHDVMPLEWEPGHQPSREWVDSCIDRIQSGENTDAFWMLTHSGPSTKILGILWAILNTKRPNTRVCEIASLWVDPDQRGSHASRLLTQACLDWAGENQITHLKCKTHSSNSRMKAILEKNHFQPGMIEYVLPFQMPRQGA